MLQSGAVSIDMDDLTTERGSRASAISRLARGSCADGDHDDAPEDRSDMRRAANARTVPRSFCLSVYRDSREFIPDRTS